MLKVEAAGVNLESLEKGRRAIIENMADVGLTLSAVNSQALLLTLEQTHLLIGVLFLSTVSTCAWLTLGMLKWSSLKSTESTTWFQKVG